MLNLPLLALGIKLLLLTYSNALFDWGEFEYYRIHQNLTYAFGVGLKETTLENYSIRLGISELNYLEKDEGILSIPDEFFIKARPMLWLIHAVIASNGAKDAERQLELYDGFVITCSPLIGFIVARLYKNGDMYLYLLNKNRRQLNAPGVSYVSLENAARSKARFILPETIKSVTIRQTKNKLLKPNEEALKIDLATCRVYKPFYAARAIAYYAFNRTLNVTTLYADQMHDPLFNCHAGGISSFAYDVPENYADGDDENDTVFKSSVNGNLFIHLNQMPT